MQNRRVRPSGPPKGFFVIDPEITMIFNAQMASDILEALDQAREVGALKPTVHSFSCVLSKKLDDLEDVAERSSKPLSGSVSKNDPDDEEDWEDDEEEYDEDEEDGN